MSAPVALLRALQAGLLAVLTGCGDPGGDVRDPPRPPSSPPAPTTGSGPTDTAPPADTAAPAPRMPGLHATFFTDYLDPVLERVEPEVDTDWGDAGPSDDVGADRFSARWTGWLTPEEGGRYTLIVDSDDGVRLWLDDVLVLEDWTGHFVTRNVAEVDLAAGQPVAVRLEYFEIDLAASIRLSWASDALPEQVVPAERLSTDGAPSPLAAPKPPYTNPVIPFDCPDPGVVAAPLGGEDVTEIPFAVVCTGGSFPIRVSRGLVSWADSGAALLPYGVASWSANGFRDWAPELHYVDGRFVGYYTAPDRADVLAIGATVSSAPGPGGVLGPYDDLGAPLVQHPHGVIDATWFEDVDGTRWLLYKPDSNAVGQPTSIYARALAPDGLSFEPGSAEVLLLTNDPASWEGGVIEAPWVIYRNGMYHLFYSGNVYDHRYRTGVARAASLLGPYEKHGAPILSNNERWVGPGHGSVVVVGAEDHLVYHAWTNDGAGGHLAGAGRHVLVDRIEWVDGWPVIGDGTPSRTPQPWPGTAP
jgi:GH43 family beta-xylosidase